MSKVLYDWELSEIVRRIVNGDEPVKDADSYRRFLEDLGDVLGKHLGAEVSCVSDSIGDNTDRDGYCVHFRATPETPKDGGVLAGFDTDVPVCEWFRESNISK